MYHTYEGEGETLPIDADVNSLFFILILNLLLQVSFLYFCYCNQISLQLRVVSSLSGKSRCLFQNCGKDARVRYFTKFNFQGAIYSS